MHLILFFTFGVSLKLWDEKGLLDREVLLYQRLLKEGIKVAFITYGDEGDYAYKERLPEIEILPFYAFTKRPKSKILVLLHSLLLPFILRDKIKKADILKTNQMLGSWVAVLASKLYRKPLIVRTGFIWSLFAIKNDKPVEHKIASFIERIAYRNANVAVVTTPNDANYISAKYGISTNKLKIIPNYIDTNVFSVINENKYEDRVIFIGRLSEQKNLKGLIQALQGLPYVLDIYGSGELKEELSQLAKNLNVKVNFMGNVPNSELPKILNQYPVFVLSSLYEGMPKALLEAMACGCAVIGTNVDGIRELIKDNVNGILCDTTAESIKSAIERVMRDKELRERLGKQARAFVVENYSLNDIVAKELNVYREICSAPHFNPLALGERNG